MEAVSLPLFRPARRSVEPLPPFFACRQVASTVHQTPAGALVPAPSCPAFDLQLVLPVKQSSRAGTAPLRRPATAENVKMILKILSCVDVCIRLREESD